MIYNEHIMCFRITDDLAAKDFVDDLEHELGLPKGTLDFVG